MTHAYKPPPPPERVPEPLRFWLHGLAAMGDERWEEAIPPLQRLVELTDQPDGRYMAYQNLSACYLALECFDDALAALDQAEIETPAGPDSLHDRGVIYACAGRLPKAIATFTEFRDRWPKQARLRDTHNLLRQLRRAQRGKSPPETYLVDHLQEQVSHNLTTGDYALVERKARRMIAADPQRPEGHFGLGLAYLEQGRAAEALAPFQIAHTLNPKHQPTLYNLGQTYLKLDQPDQALVWFERARKREPQNPATLHQLGLACERLGRREEAVDYWQRALRIDPQYLSAQQRLHEVSAGPPPVDPPLPPESQMLRRMLSPLKTHMKQPQVYRTDAVTLTYDAHVGFVLEDRGNARNGTIHAGGPFRTAFLHDEDLLDLLGLVKLLLRLMNAENTRSVAVIVYYAERPAFYYQARWQDGKLVEDDHDGQFVVTEVPRFFKLRIDSDLSTTYGEPMQGMLIYLNQQPKPGFMINTLGLDAS